MVRAIMVMGKDLHERKNPEFGVLGGRVNHEGGTGWVLKVNTT
jgi:hypothetical protein